MEKAKQFPRVLFTPDVIKRGSELCAALSKSETRIGDLSVARGLEEWSFDNESEFFAEIRRGYDNACFAVWFGKDLLTVRLNRDYATVSKVKMKGSSREAIEQIFEIFEHAAERCTVPKPPDEKVAAEPPVIFIGHGGSKDWRDLKDHLQDKHELKVEAYEVGSRAGHTIREVLGSMMSRSSIAFLVLSAEDQGVDGKFRARDNVIHELGLFQGRLGFARAIVVLEQEANEFSNIEGLQQLRYTKGNIREVFGEALAVIKREFAPVESVSK